MKIHLKVLLDVATDLGALWADVAGYSGVHLGGENSRYLVSYDGEKAQAMEILDICLKYADYGKFYADFRKQ